MKRLLLLLMVVLLCISGCGSSSRSQNGGVMEDSVAPQAPEAQYDMENKSDKGSGEGGVSDVQLQDRKIIQNAEIRLRVEDIEGVCEKIKSKTVELKGYLNDYSVNTNENNANADISVKIPGSNYQALLEFIVVQGKADFKREYTNDVTTEYIDLDARVKVLRAEEEILIKLLDRAEKIEDILQMHRTSTRQERESLEGQFIALKNSIEYATINISLYKPRNSDANVNVDNLNIFSRSFSALIYGFNSLTAKVGNVVVFLFAALPTLILIGLAIVVFVFIRKRRKGKGEGK